MESWFGTGTGPPLGSRRASPGGPVRSDGRGHWEWADQHGAQPPQPPDRVHCVLAVGRQRCICFFGVFSRFIILPMLTLLVMVLVMVIVMILVLQFFSWYRHDMQNVSNWRKSKPLEKMEMFMGCLISRGAVTAGGAWHPLRLARQGPRRLLHRCARPQRRWLPPVIPASERSV